MNEQNHVVMVRLRDGREIEYTKPVTQARAQDIIRHSQASWCKSANVVAWRIVRHDYDEPIGPEPATETEAVSEFNPGDVVKYRHREGLFVVFRRCTATMLRDPNWYEIYALEDRYPYNTIATHADNLMLYRAGDEVDAEMLDYFESLWEKRASNKVLPNEFIWLRPGTIRGYVQQVDPDHIETLITINQPANNEDHSFLWCEHPVVYVRVRK